MIKGSKILINMNILLILNKPPPYGGGEILGAMMAEYFSSIPGYTVITHKRKNASKKTQGRITLANIIDGISWITSGIKHIQEYKCDQVYLSIPKTFLPFVRIIPLIEFAHRNNVRLLGELAGANFSFLSKSRLLSRIGYHYLSKFHSIRYLGQSIKKNYDSIGLSNSVVIDNGIMAPSLLEGKGLLAHSRPLRLLYVGALNRSKGIDKLVSAVDILIHSGHDVCCTFIGEWNDNTLKKEIQNHCESNPELKERLMFKGLILGNDKWDEYRSSSLLVHPTTWDGQPLTILEAMAMGLGIISTGVGAIPDTIEDTKNGKILKSNEPKEIAEAVSGYYNNPEELLKVIRNNREKYENRFTETTYLENMRKWFEGTS